MKVAAIAKTVVGTDTISLMGALSTSCGAVLSAMRSKPGSHCGYQACVSNSSTNLTALLGTGLDPHQTCGRSQAVPPSRPVKVSSTRGSKWHTSHLTSSGERLRKA